MGKWEKNVDFAVAKEDGKFRDLPCSHGRDLDDLSQQIEIGVVDHLRQKWSSGPASRSLWPPVRSGRAQPGGILPLPGILPGCRCGHAGWLRCWRDTVWSINRLAVAEGDPLRITAHLQRVHLRTRLVPMRYMAMTSHATLAFSFSPTTTSTSGGRPGNMVIIGLRSLW